MGALCVGLLIVYAAIGGTFVIIGKMMYDYYKD